VPGEIHALYLSGEYAYVAGTRFSVIDISDPTTPTLLDTTYLTRTLRVYDMTRYGDTLYLAGEGALVSFDVSDLENPTSETLVKEFSSIDSYSAAVGGDYLYYLYEDTNDFHGYRLTDGEPSNINIASHNPLDIAVAGDYALVATYQDNTTDLSELVVVDISTFQSEAVVGTPISMSGKVLHDIDVQGSWVFGAYSDQDYQDGGLVIFNLNGTE